VTAAAPPSTLRAPPPCKGEAGWGVRAVAVMLALLFVTLPALGTEPSEMLKDPALEARARDIGRALRCVVCQNQSIDDSSAEVARDMRRAVRERVSAGDSDRQVFDFMVARYGDYVLLQPPFRAGTLVLWLGGPLVLLLAGGALLLAARRRRAVVAATPAPLSDEERKRVDGLLQDTVAPSPSTSLRSARDDG
jgi:cytochrome c-type biogenesis protein CcmH